MNEATYIVRVYRQDADNHDALVGLVEVVETEEKKIFKSSSELLNILTFKRKRKDGKRRRGKG
jgi:hypothetical protein